jgi:malate synthase
MADTTNLTFHDADDDWTGQLDRLPPADLAARPRRSLRIAEALLEEALTNVRDALHPRRQEQHG